MVQDVATSTLTSFFFFPLLITKIIEWSCFYAAVLLSPFEWLSIWAKTIYSLRLGKLTARVQSPLGPGTFAFPLVLPSPTPFRKSWICHWPGTLGVLDSLWAWTLMTLWNELTWNWSKACRVLCMGSDDFPSPFLVQSIYHIFLSPDAISPYLTKSHQLGKKGLTVERGGEGGTEGFVLIKIYLKIHLIPISLSSKNAKREKKKVHRNKLDMLTTFRE